MNPDDVLLFGVAGETYRLRYTINTLCMLEDRAGMSISRLMDRQFSATRLLLWAGLVGDMPQLSVHDAGDLMLGYIQRGGSLQGIVDMCAEGLRAAGFLSDGASQATNTQEAEAREADGSTPPEESDQQAPTPAP